MRKFFLSAVLLCAVSACASVTDAIIEGNARVRAWACAPTTTMPMRKAALANANALRASAFLPPRIAFDCDGDGKPDF